MPIYPVFSKLFNWLEITEVADYLDLRSPVGAIRGNKRLLFLYRVLPSIGKLATRWRDCGDLYYDVIFPS